MKQVEVNMSINIKIWRLGKGDIAEDHIEELKTEGMNQAKEKMNEGYREGEILISLPTRKDTVNITSIVTPYRGYFTVKGVE